MKKLISIMLTLTLLLSFAITVSAEDTEMVGGNITLTQFLGATPENTRKITILYNGKTATVDTASFNSLADNIILTSSLDVKQAEMNGLYLMAEKTDGTYEYAYIDKIGGVDKYSAAMSRLPYALYLANDLQLVSQLFQLSTNVEIDSITVSNWAAGEIEKAKNYNLIPNDFALTDYTQNITREKFCELAYETINRLGKIDAGSDLDNTAPFTDTGNKKIIQLHHIGIINGKSENKFAPNDNITREEAATILDRMANYSGIKSGAGNDIAYSDDNDISNWAKEAVYNMHQMGIMIGTGNGFGPKSYYTVEQAIVTMVRLYHSIA